MGRGFAMKRAVILICVLVALGLGSFGLVLRYPHLLPEAFVRLLGGGRDIAEIRERVTPGLTNALADQGLALGAPVFIRIFKEEAELELWVRGASGFELFRSYPICNYSGALGPKLAEGDRQSPEGFYRVEKSGLNPHSRYHLSFNLGFPNAFDRAQGRTGSFLMVHGNCVSIGCYAMTDPMIEEIYVLVEAALNAGQRAVDVHAFPFRMTLARMAQAEGHAAFGFWTGIKPGYDVFEALGEVPFVSVEDGRYVFSD